MKDVPTSMDALVMDSRKRIAALRRVYGNRADFDQYVKRAIAESLEGYPPKVRQFVLDSMFGKENHHA